MLAAPAAANNGLPCFKQGDCPSADAGSTVSATAAAQSNQMPVVSSDQMLAVQSGQLAEAAANANDPALKQGDCSPADADSAVRYVENSPAARDEQPPDKNAANSLAAAAATARLMESPPSVLKQGDCSAADTGRSARQNTNAAAQNAQDLAAAQQNTDSLAAAAATARLKESPSAISQQENCSAGINFGSIIRLLFYRFKFSVIGFLFYRFKYSAQLSDLSGLKFDMASTFDYLFLKE
jgi:hypothetical protein